VEGKAELQALHVQQRALCKGAVLREVEPAYVAPHLRDVLVCPGNYPSSVTGKARKPFGNGKLFAVRETTPPAVTRALPITFRPTSREIHMCKTYDTTAYSALLAVWLEPQQLRSCEGEPSANCCRASRGYQSRGLRTLILDERVGDIYRLPVTGERRYHLVAA
jgi:hypothetical protein